MDIKGRLLDQAMILFKCIPFQTGTSLKGKNLLTPQCFDKMLSNNTFSETRIQRLRDGLNFVEKGLGVHVQRMLKMSRVYTLAEILSKIFVKKKRMEIGDLIYDHGLTN